MTLSLESMLAIAAQAAGEAAKVLAEGFRADAGIESLSGKDIKTRADREAERRIRELLQATGLPILGEEAEDKRGLDTMDWLWVVDPLDGTLNFARGFPVCGVSVGLWRRGHPVLGVVYDLSLGRMIQGICAEREAFRGPTAFQVSTIRETAQATLCTGFPSGRDYGDEALLRFVRQVQGFKKIRMIGSAAMSLSYVAQGVFDAYSEEDIYFWDVAAGIALVLAAGGRVFHTPPSAEWKMNVWADNGLLDFHPPWPNALCLPPIP